MDINQLYQEIFYGIYGQRDTCIRYCMFAPDRTIIPLGAWGTYRLLLKEYVDELKEYIRSKKHDADDESGSTYDKEYEKELKSMRKKSPIE